MNSFNIGQAYLRRFESESTVKLWYCIFWSSYLHCEPNLNLHSDEQHGSSLRWRSPGSHSSPFSTLEFPHTLLFLSLKHTGALKRNVFAMEILLQLEKRFGGEGKVDGLNLTRSGCFLLNCERWWWQRTATRKITSTAGSKVCKFDSIFNLNTADISKCRKRCATDKLFTFNSEKSHMYISC